MDILLVASTRKAVQHLAGLTSAGTNIGHRVSIFLNSRSVSLLYDDRLRDLDCQILVCRTSAVEAGIDEGKIYEGAQMSSLGEMVKLVDESDRVVFLG